MALLRSSFLVIGTQKGGTSSFHWLLREGWHNRIQVQPSPRFRAPRPALRTVKPQYARGGRRRMAGQ